MNRTRMFGFATFAVLAGAPMLAGCPEDVQDELCCNEFKVGATLGAEISGSAQGQVAAQAVADVAGIASAAVDDITTACRSIAQDLDAPKDGQNAAEQNGSRRDKLNAWCKLALDAIARVKGTASGTLTVEFQPPRCEASISAKANCQAKCSAEGKCDVKANPPRCTGGSLQVACKGECTAKAGATLKCEGKCTGECKGSCTAQGGVECAGRCNGTCRGGGKGGGGGVQADGTCQGTCEGTCEVTAPGATCSGSCNGECSASCTGTAEASVKCDGECKADFEPISCEGGKLEGGCQVEAKCDANCDASVKAKAQCTPPAVRVVFAGAANIEAAGKLQATLEANLPLVLAFRARLDGMAEIAASMSGNVQAFADIKTACLPVIAAAAASAGEDIGASFKATVDIAGAVGAK